MKEYVNKYTFRNRFRSSDNYANQFSTKGLDALFEYIEQVEDDIGEEFEFDMIGICCDYTEYDDFEQFKDMQDKPIYWMSSLDGGNRQKLVDAINKKGE